MAEKFPSEAALVASFIDQLSARHSGGRDWTVYHETAGWDLLLVHRAGFQCGLEAKLTFNAKVIDQALEGQHRYYRQDGPDYRGVLVPQGGSQHHLGRICAAIGLGVVEVRRPERGVTYGLGLPGQESFDTNWPCWAPAQRCKLPEYVPDVQGGKSSPVALTDWKIKAIKLAILLERRGAVHRGDMVALNISPSRWTDRWNGFLDWTPGGYVRNGRTPDLRAQHPVNYAEIEADYPKWCPPGYRIEAAP